MRVAFLFDNDGVLIDSSAFHWRAWELFMQEEPALKMDKSYFIKTFGKRNDLILKELMPQLTDETIKAWADKKEELFRKNAQGKISLLPGMEIFLKKVYEAKIPHIIASSTPVANLEMFLNSTILGKYFEHFVSAEEVAHGKPAPDIFIAAAHRLKYTPSECIVFEDSPAGIEAGKAAGSFVVALETSLSKDQLSDYDLVYSSAHELNLQEILNAFTLWFNQL